MPSLRYLRIRKMSENPLKIAPSESTRKFLDTTPRSSRVIPPRAELYREVSGEPLEMSGYYVFLSFRK